MLDTSPTPEQTLPLDLPHFVTPHHLTKLTRQSRKRAEKMISEGRQPQHNGRPAYMTLEEENLLVLQISTWKNPREQPTRAGIPKMVWIVESENC
jgi:hypothetical protein